MEFPCVHVYLAPIMTTATRSALRRMDMYLRRRQLSSSDAAHLFLGIIRSAIETQQTHSQRVHVGLRTLLKVVNITTEDLSKAIRGSRAIPPQMAGYVHEYVKSLEHPMPRPPAVRDPRLQEYYRMREQDLQKRRRVKRLAEQEYRRKMKEKKDMEIQQERAYRSRIRPSASRPGSF